MDKDFPDIDIATENRDASVALVLPMSGSWRQEPGALEKLQNYIEKHKIVTRGKPFIRYFNDYNKVPEEEYLWEIGTPVQEGTQAKAPFEIKYFPKERIAYAVMKYDEDKFMDQCYSLALRAMIHGYFSNDYVFMILEDGSLKQGMRRKMCVPVREKRSNQSELPKFM